MKKNIIYLFVSFLSLTIPTHVVAFESFRISEIKIVGLERISIGTVLNYLPVSDGDYIDESNASETIRALFRSGFFDDVILARNNDVLIIEVDERPAISKISITGNEDIETEQLTDALRSIGLTEGRVFNRSSLDKIERELENQYYSQGKYGIRVESSVEELAKNQVKIQINIDEGAVARIKDINIVGNTVYSDPYLMEKFKLEAPGKISFFSTSDQYSRQKLAGDLETLRSHYLDNGYINFSIDSTQVSITPDKQDVYITINITEGDKFMIDSVKITGDLPLPEEEINSLITIKEGDIFSRRNAQQSITAINDRLGQEGFAFANVTTSPKIDKENKVVTLSFFIDPGKRVYVRRINIAGNLKTQDDVLRREIRQMEGGWISTDKIARSRVRLQRLGFFDEVNVETPQVPGIDDQVDINISVTERPSGSLMAGMGYSQSQGFLVNASVSQNNVLGTGKRVSATINNSSVNTIYSFSFTNPYHTIDGVSRGYNVYNRKTDAGEANVSDFTSDVYGAGINYGFPLDEYNTATVSLGYENTKLKAGSGTPPLQYTDFISSNSDQFDIYKLSSGFSHDTRNRSIFADEGSHHRVSAEITIPGSGLEFYKLRYRGTKFYPLIRDLTFMTKGEVAFGDSYGDTNKLPFFENFYAGGTQSVRGFRGNSLGPRGVDDNNPLGGAFKVIGNMELIFPAPFTENNTSLRMSAFFDIGNVFAEANDFEFNELRYSIGVSAIWYTPVAPMTFSFSWPLNDEPDDETERFQFTLGSFFF